jgi:hypothetical protein
MVLEDVDVLEYVVEDVNVVDTGVVVVVVSVKPRQSVSQSNSFVRSFVASYWILRLRLATQACQHHHPHNHTNTTQEHTHLKKRQPAYNPFLPSFLSFNPTQPRLKNPLNEQRTQGV